VELEFWTQKFFLAMPLCCPHQPSSWWNGDSENIGHILWNLHRCQQCHFKQVSDTTKRTILPELLHFFRVGVDYTNNVSFTYQNLYADVELCVFSVQFIGTRLLAVCWSKQSTPRAKFCLRFAHFVFIFSVMLFCCCWISCSSKSNTIVACTTTSV